jgi:hypothetical protein
MKLTRLRWRLPLHRLHPLVNPVGLLVVVTVLLLAFLTHQLSQVVADQRAVSEHLAERAELRGVEMCHAHNEVRAVMARLLDELLAEPRPDDEPGEHAERLRLRAQVDPHVQPVPCPEGRLRP